MNEPNIKRASLAEIERMNEAGELFHDPNAAEGDDLGPGFWDSAELVEPMSTQPVLLKIDKDVFDFFKGQGKGHVTRMQNVLKAYVKAQRKRA